MNKNVVYYFIFTLACISISRDVYAVATMPGQLRREVREERREFFEEKRASIAAVRARIQTRAELLKAVVVSKGTDSLIVKTNDGKEYTVKTDANTQWRRKFWGKSDFSEISVNDVLNIHGKWIDEAGTQIQARLIRNVSIQKRNGVFFGTVKTLSTNGWVMTTVKRGDQTVTISGTTQLVDRKQMTISQSSITAGHRVRVKGLWDSANNAITEVTQVKDFDLPAKANPTP